MNPNLPTNTGVFQPPPVQRPVIDETQRMLNAGRYVEAVTYAYQHVVDDVIRAFSLRPPKQWTHREFLTWGIRPDMGYFTSLLPRLYAVYEPVRYGEKRDWHQDDVIGLLRLIYAEEPMVRLYAVLSFPTTHLQAPPGPGPVDPTRFT